jgi:predicted dehydrogenase
MAQETMAPVEIYTDWREMLDRAPMDAVLICTPHHLHTEPAVAALERGLHVLVEKPMALTAEDAWSMVEAARKADCVLMATYAGRFSGQTRTAKCLLDEGRIGALRQLAIAFTAYRRFLWTAEEMPAGWRTIAAQSGLPAEFFANWGRQGHWFTEPEKVGGGMFADVGAHQVSMALYLGGAPPTEVVAFTESVGLSVECFVSAQARLANGVMVSLISADANPGAVVGKGMWTAIGDEGTLTADWNGDLWIDVDGRQEQAELTVPRIDPATAFVNCVLDGAPNLAPGEHGAHAVAFAEAVYRSAAEGVIVNL